MQEPNPLHDPVSSPDIQDMIMSHRIGIIAAELARRLGVGAVEAMEMFYASRTCADLHDKTTGLYLYGDLYVADEFMRERAGARDVAGGGAR